MSLRKIYPRAEEGLHIYQPDSDRILEAPKYFTIQVTNQFQSSLYLGTRGAQSFVPSESYPSLYSVIEKYKLNYIENYNAFSEMRLIENLAGLKSTAEKQQLIVRFKDYFEEMVVSLDIIQKTILSINFSTLDSTNMDPQQFLEILYKDVKTLEGLHVELIYSSSLRYLQTVTEVQNLELVTDIHSVDIKIWSQQCLAHIFKFKNAQKQQKKRKTCWARFCKIINPKKDSQIQSY